MIGALPRYDQAPLDYRYALDAAMTWLARCQPVAVVSRIPALSAEIDQRLMAGAGEGQSGAGLWAEPLLDQWRTDLADLAARLTVGAPLVVVAAQPLARILPECRRWPGTPLGIQPGGLRQLQRALTLAGFRIEERHGLHSLSAILLNQSGQLLARGGRPDWGDRLEFAARLRYCAAPPWTVFATVSLWLARRQA